MNTRVSSRVGRGLAAGRRRLEVAAAPRWSCPPWSGAGGAGRALGPSGSTAGGGGASTPGSSGWDADSGAPLAGRQVRVAANSPNLRGVAAQSRRLAG